MTLDEVREIVGCISYKPGWSVNVHEGALFNGYIQISVSGGAEACMSPLTGEYQEWKGAKIPFSAHMCRQEIVGLVFGAIRAAEEHEMKEWFRYRGAAIYNPHLDPDALVTLARKKINFNFRANAMSMEEEAK